MTTANIRTALDTFQQAANHGTAVYLSLELVQELRDALKAEPEGDDGDDVIARWIESRPGCPDDWPAVTHPPQLTALIGEALEHWGRTTTPPAPEPVEGRWTEGICGDGAAILRDGVMIPIEEVVQALNRIPTALPAPEASEEQIEEAAKLIYGSMRFAVSDSHGACDWVERGNSLMQDEARRTARAILANRERPAIPAIPAIPPATEPGEWGS